MATTPASPTAASPAATTAAGGGAASASVDRAGFGASAARPIAPWQFTAVAVASFGGPLALAALVAPGVITGPATASAGLAMVAAVVVFGGSLAVWLGYARRVSGPGGLTAYVEAAAGRRLALVQAAIWIVSYALYVIYTTEQVVYELLPAVIPGERRDETLLALLLPVALVAVMIAGRRVTLAVLAVIAVGQVALAGVLDGVTLAHVATPTSSFGTGAGTGPLAGAGAQTALLYICGSLPLFLSGELARPARTVRRGLIGAYLLTAVLVVLAVAPLAALPGVAGTALPGVTVVTRFAGVGWGRAVGIGVAASTAGVMLCEYLALSRLVQALGSLRPRPVALGLGALFLVAAPLMLINPIGLYDALAIPSFVALWLSQLIVFAVYPMFVRRRGGAMLPACALTLVAGGLAGYGLWLAISQSVF